MKFVLLTIFLPVSLLSNAQIKKGALFIGGDISLYGSHAKGVEGNPVIRNMNNYYFSPSIGWAVKDNVIVGGRLLASYSEDKELEPSGYETKGNRIGAAIWMRNYLPLGNSFFLFTDASLGGQSIYMKQTYEVPVSLYKEKGYAINAVVYPGLSYRVKKSVFIEVALNNLFSVSYERKNTEQGSSGPFLKRVVNNYGFSTSIGNGVPLQVGIRWIIAKTRK